jgi:hypothetical protein
LYVSDILSSLDDATVRETVEASITAFRNHPEPKPAYTETILNRLPSDNENAGIAVFWKMRSKLVDLLQSKLTYDAVSTLDQIAKRKDLLLAELVILYGRVR